MKKYPILCIAVIMLLISCKKSIPFLTASNLTSTFITVNAGSAYTLQTPKGAIIKIDSNSFDLPANFNVKIEVKEAYAERDILLAGLSTVSNGRLLQSGGMIYLNATADGKAVSVIKPIQVSIPTKNFNANMQLFKGEIKADGSINWVDPQPLDSQVTKTPNGVAPADSIKMDSSRFLPSNATVDIASMGDSAAPCGYDTIYTPLPDTSITILPANTSDPYSTLPAFVPQASVYDFNISESGWYNIDCFIDANINVVTTVHLTAVLDSIPEEVKNVEVYIAIPSRKLLSDERGNSGNAYTFYDANNDSIQLILKDDAFIFAVGNNGDKVFYGLSKFTVKDQQSIHVTIRPSTKEAVTKSLLNNSLDSSRIDPDVPGIVNYGSQNQPSIDTTDATMPSDTTPQKMKMEIVPNNCHGSPMK